jgi:hypothetical protein
MPKYIVKKFIFIPLEKMKNPSDRKSHTGAPLRFCRAGCALWRAEVLSLSLEILHYGLEINVLEHL